MSEKRYRIVIRAFAEDMVTGEKEPDVDLELKYTNVPYDGFVAIEIEIVELLQRLTNLGIAQAESLGLGEKMKTLRSKNIKRMNSSG